MMLRFFYLRPTTVPKLDWHLNRRQTADRPVTLTN